MGNISSNPAYLSDCLRQNARLYPNKPAIVFEGQTTSWQELWQKVEIMSSFLITELGTKNQKVVDLLLTNSIDFVVVYLAVVHAGHIALPLDPAYKKLELDAIIKQIPPALIVTSTRYIERIDQAGLEVILVDKLLKAKGSDISPLRLPADKQIASLTFTSGTSGKPKAVPNTHSNHLWNIKVCSQIWEWTTTDSLLISLPLSHWYGLVMGLSGALYHANTLYLQQQAFNSKETLEMLSSGKVTLFTHVPLAYSKMLALNNPQDYDLSSVRVCISGGAPLAKNVWSDFKKQFGVEIVETYGSSETGRIAGNLLTAIQPGSPGKVMPGVRFRLSSAQEVEVRSPGLFPGYFHNTSATRAATTADGYWKTGDIAELKNGYVYLKGRSAERIRRFGYSVSPRDVEWALTQNPAISEAFVLGQQQLDDPNDKLIYFLVTRLTEEQIIDYCKDNLVFAWRADKIIYLPSLPRTNNGKVKIAKLKQMAT